MGLRQLLAFLCGSRQAVNGWARTPRALWFGFVCVMAAALCREYDQLDLVANTVILGLPLAGSLAASFLLFVVLWVQGTQPRTARSFAQGYREFLALFWLTAPLAFLYAIPYEMLFSAYTATVLNLLTLALVAAWRVMLMVRVAQVRFGLGPVPAVTVVGGYGIVVAWLAVAFSPVPVIEMMGGLAHSPERNLLNGLAFFVLFFGFPAMVVAGLVALIVTTVRASSRKAPAATDDQPRLALAWHSWLLPAAIIPPLLAAIPFLHSPQIYAQKADAAILAGDYDTAREILNGLPRDYFPADWQPELNLVSGYPRAALPILPHLKRYGHRGWAGDYYDQALLVAVQRDDCTWEDRDCIEFAWHASGRNMGYYNSNVLAHYYDGASDAYLLALKMRLEAALQSGVSKSDDPYGRAYTALENVEKWIESRRLAAQPQPGQNNGAGISRRVEDQER
ncbi:MAG: hypothetical protein IT463_02525 [Planctomycetes bacterium]|nr:hypothetical protein [Planctomycetota bacterium]